MIDVPDSEGYRFIVGPTDQLHLKKLYLYQLEKDLCPKKESTVNRKPKKSSSSTAEILLMFSFGVAHPDPFFDCLGSTPPYK